MSGFLFLQTYFKTFFLLQDECSISLVVFSRDENEGCLRRAFRRRDLRGEDLVLLQALTETYTLAFSGISCSLGPPA